jgi:predicted RNase H-like HicB family nuclease
VASCGDTFEQAVFNLKEAVDLYLENAEELGLMEDIEESLTSKEKYTARLEVTVQ